MWRSLYDLFTDSVEEQGLYHSIATVGTLLLQIGEVGKRFRHNTDTSSASGGMSPFRDMEVEGQLEEVVDQGRKEGSGEQAKVGDIVEVKESKEGEGEKSKISMTQDEKGGEAAERMGEGEGKSTVLGGDKRDNNLSAVSKAADAQESDAANENSKGDIGDSTATSAGSNLSQIPQVQLSPAENNPMTDSPKNTSKPDADWSVSFEQLLASMLTEPPLVDFFERIYDTTDAVASLRNRRLVTRMHSASPEKS